jgi:hypothetical protein
MLKKESKKTTYSVLLDEIIGLQKFGGALCHHLISKNLLSIEDFKQILKIAYPLLSDDALSSVFKKNEKKVDFSNRISHLLN